MSKPVLATAVQMASGPNVSANLLEAERWVAEAAQEGSSLVVLPENFAFMGQICADILGLREPYGEGPLQEFLGQLAKRHGVWVVGGTIPLESDDISKVRPACLVFDDQGKQVARYDKIHLFDANLVETHESYTESRVFEAGDSTQLDTIETPFGRLGVAVCYDLRFPELFRTLLDKGLDIIALPSAFTAVTGKAHWEPLVRARAIENLSYVIAAGQGGYHISGRETYGHSMSVNPWGNILGELPRGTGALTRPLDLDYQRTTPHQLPSLDHRRIRCS